MPQKTVDLSQGANRRIILKRSAFTRILESWIDIHVPASEAWDALIDMGSWGQWNSFIPSVEGELAVGRRMKIKVVSPGMKEMTFEPDLLGRRVFGFCLQRHSRIHFGTGRFQHHPVQAD